MVKAGPRIGFNSAALIRLLAELAQTELAQTKLAQTELAPSKQPLAERLGLWLGWADAIALATALTGPAAVAAVAVGAGALAARPFGETSSARVAADDLARVRADLAQAIGTDAALLGSDGPAGNAADFSPFRRHYQAQQRVMAARIGPLRARVRAAVAGASPRLGQLAALDATLDNALGARERKLLAAVPSWLEKRFHHLRQAHLATPAAAPAPGGAAQCPPPAAWRAVFYNELQAVLRAEIDLRLQPVDGLIDALHQAQHHEP